MGMEVKKNIPTQFLYIKALWVVNLKWIIATKQLFNKYIKIQIWKPADFH